MEEELITKFEKETQSKLKNLESKHKDDIEAITQDRDLLQKKLDQTKTKVFKIYNYNTKILLFCKSLSARAT